MREIRSEGLLSQKNPMYKSFLTGLADEPNREADVNGGLASWQ